MVEKRFLIKLLFIMDCLWWSRTSDKWVLHQIHQKGWRVAGKALNLLILFKKCLDVGTHNHIVGILSMVRTYIGRYYTYFSFLNKGLVEMGVPNDRYLPIISRYNISISRLKGPSPWQCVCPISILCINILCNNTLLYTSTYA